LRPVTGVTKLNPSIFSKVYLNFFSLLVGILESFLGSCQSSSCQHAPSNFSYTGSDAFIRPLLPDHQPRLLVAYPVSTDEALTPESQHDNCYISAGGNASTHRVWPEALKVATLPLDYHSLG
jgi:hypothetical protein